MPMTEKGCRWVPYEKTLSQTVAPGVVRRVLAFSNDIMCVENSFDDGAVGPMHSHPHTQITYVVSGEFSFTIEGETRVVKAGDSMLKENGPVHGCTCLKKGVLLDIFTPMREDFVN